jgi:predicted Co/Zn/Cd cation transporter (cation efflux family)
MMSEQSILKVSIGTTAFVAVIGVVFGVISGSSAIVFDGIYSLTDASMTTLALFISNLIGLSQKARGRFTQRFSVGFWHLEPMILGLNGALLTGSAVYGLINATSSIMQGGRDLPFGLGIAYSALAVAASLAMAIYVTRANRVIQSTFLKLDAKAWMISAALTGSLLAAFLFGYMIQGTRLAWMTPYVDPGILAVACLFIIPIPLGTVRQALADILLIAPIEMRQQVDDVASGVVLRHGFISHRAYVARVGRGRQIEIHFIVPKGLPARPLDEWDRLRNEIGDLLGGEGPNRWLTIAFTTDPEWAE